MDMNKKYVAPERNKNSFTCPHYRIINEMEFPSF